MCVSPQRSSGVSKNWTLAVLRSCCDTTLSGKLLAIALMRTNAGKPGAQRGVEELNLRCAEKLPFDGILAL